MSQVQQHDESPVRVRYFDMQAEMGLTKHLGGQMATDRLIEACHIGPGSRVLDVGCGVGATPCKLARNLGCRVTGVDLHPGMVARSRERAAREGVEDLVDFERADVQALPFADETFDAVITESVLAFAEDKAKAVSECRRVTRPGGYIGFNEATWLVPPDSEMLDELLGAYGAHGSLLNTEGWEALLVEAGLEAVQARSFEVSAREEAIGRFRRYGMREMLLVWGRFFGMVLRHRAGWARLATDALSSCPDLMRHMGYGIYVGRRGSS